MIIKNYSDFKNFTQTLQSWDPNSQYISRNLTFKNKPKRNTCFEKFLSIFRKSKASEAIVAVRTIHFYANFYKNDLKNHQESLSILEQFNRNILNNLIEDNATHLIRSKEKRTELKQECEKINVLCQELFDTTRVSSREDSSSSDFSTMSWPSPKNKSDINSSSSLHDSEVVYFQKSEELKDYLSTMQPSSAEEATALFENLVEALVASDRSEVLDQENGNDLLIQIAQIKRQFIDKGNKHSERNLRRAALHLSTLVRREFFYERIQEMRAQVKSIEQNLDKSDGSTSAEILKEWKKKLRKYKPIAIPKYYHCTKGCFVESIIYHREGILEKAGFYPGAFVSSMPEEEYGPFCFAISSYVEERALADKPPIVTNVNNFDYNGTIRTDREPIYFESSVPKTEKKASPHAGQPKIWLGLQQTIVLRKANKNQNPLEYYRNTTLSVFGHMTDSLQLDRKCVEELKKRKVRILDAREFQELINLVQRSQYFVLPDQWKDDVKPPRAGIGSLAVKATSRSQGNNVALKDFVGVFV